MTLAIDLIDSSALDLLRDMERDNLIRVNPPDFIVEETPPPYATEGGRSKQAVSRRFAGALHLSAERHAAFQSALQKGRDEWERDTY
jgi:hypothetical protein